VTALLPRARRASRLLAAGSLVASAALSRRPPGGIAQQAMVLAALVLGMPHGASDTELLRTAARGSRTRHGALIGAYLSAAAGATVLVRRGGGAVERGVLLASAAHFGEGETACWTAPPAGASRHHGLLRGLTAAVTTVALPAAVALANRRPAEVGLTGALSSPAGRTAAVGASAGPPRVGAGSGRGVPARATGERSGLALLADPTTRRAVVPLTTAAAAGVAALAAAGDREAAADSALLLALDLVAPPSLAFATYFGGWHALRHTARVVDALVADGELPEQTSLPGAVLELGRRSAWAAGVGLVASAVLALSDREHASDNAFAAVLGLTVPHMTTVAAELTRRGR
jgi:beta-carotene 15,15'-dioxygenase